MISSTAVAERATTSSRPAAPLASKILMGWWAIYLLLSPFYLLRSGNPQPADLFLVATLPFILFIFPLRMPQATLILSGLAFVTYVWMINIFWWGNHFVEGFMITSLFYLYNMVVFYLVAMLARHDRQQFVQAMYVLIFALILIQLAVIVFDIRFFRIREMPRLESWRAIGTFNNPNQLGYWSILMAACLVALGHGRRLAVVETIGLLALGYLASLSLSRAAMFSILVLTIIAIVWRGVTARSIMVMCCAAIVLVGLAGLGKEPVKVFKESDVYSNVVKRWEKDKGDETPEARGYGRMIDHPQYLIFGAGEGFHQRFRADGSEFHSSWGVLLFHYGAVGSVLFLAFMVAVFHRAAWGQILLMGPIAFYGLTHQGLRFTLFWIFLGIVAGMSGGGRPREVGRADQPTGATRWWPARGNEERVRRGG